MNQSEKKERKKKTKIYIAINGKLKKFIEYCGPLTFICQLPKNTYYQRHRMLTFV